MKSSEGGGFKTSMESFLSNCLNGAKISSLCFIISCYRLATKFQLNILNEAKFQRKLIVFYQSLSPLEQCLFIRNINIELVRNTSKTLSSRNYLNCWSETNFFLFSTSKRWTAQEEFYRFNMLKAWESNIVPYEVSSNSYVARQYINAIFEMTSYSNDLEHSLCIVEIGAGHGILSYLMALELKKMRRRHSMVICTDFHSNTFKQQLLHLPWIRELCDLGYLDFAACRAICADPGKMHVDNDMSSNTDQPQDLYLLHAKNYLSSCVAGSYRDVVVVGNYALDSFPVDLVAVTARGDVCEIGVCSLPSSGDSGRSKEHYAARPLRAQPHRHCKDCKDTPISTSTARGSKRQKLDICMCNRCVKHSTYYNLIERVKHASHMLCGNSCASHSCFAEEGIYSFLFPPEPLPVKDRGCVCSCGVYSIHVSTTKLLQNIYNLFPSREYSGLIVGDYFISPDDSRWQANLFEECILYDKGRRSGGCDEDSDSGLSWTGYSCPGFDPPFISPCHEALAIPLNFPSVVAAFQEAIHDPTNANPTLQYSYLSSTALFATDFSVVSMGSKRNVTKGIVQREQGKHVDCDAMLDLDTDTSRCANVLIDRDGEVDDVDTIKSLRARETFGDMRPLREFSPADFMTIKHFLQLHLEEEKKQRLIFHPVRNIDFQDKCQSTAFDPSTAFVCNVSLDALQEMIEFSNYDWNTIISLRSAIIQKLRAQRNAHLTRDESDDSLNRVVGRWSNLAGKCWANQVSCSLDQYIGNRTQIMRFLMCLHWKGCEVASEVLGGLYHASDTDSCSSELHLCIDGDQVRVECETAPTAVSYVNALHLHVSLIVDGAKGTNRAIQWVLFSEEDLLHLLTILLAVWRDGDVDGVGDGDEDEVGRSHSRVLTCGDVDAKEDRKAKEVLGLGLGDGRQSYGPLIDFLFVLTRQKRICFNRSKINDDSTRIEVVQSIWRNNCINRRSRKILRKIEKLEREFLILKSDMMK